MSRIETLNGQGFVELIDSMGDDDSIVRAARVSYGGDLGERDQVRDRKLIRYLLANRHTSPFEHVTYTFHVKAPIFVARQWMRHRTWKYNEVSARYTEVEDEYYAPWAWRGQSKDNKQMSDGYIDLVDDVAASVVYDETCKHALATYRFLLNRGVSREMARMVLPQSMFTRFYATVDLHNLMHFLGLRDHPHAQDEIREYARAMKKLAAGTALWSIETWEDLHGHAD